MPSDDDIEKLLTDHGYGPKTNKPVAPAAPAGKSDVAPATARAVAPAAAAPAPNRDPLKAETPRSAPSWLAPTPRQGMEARDVGRGLLHLGGDMRRIGRAIAPNFEQSLETLVKQVPGAQSTVRAGRKFANEPAEEPLGEFAGEYGPLLAADLPGAGAKIAEDYALKALFPRMTAQGSKIAPKTAEAVRKWLIRGGRAAGGATGGAIGGAIGDPEHPGQGAAIGAATGLAPAVLNNSITQHIAGHALSLGGAELAHDYFGIPRGTAYSIAWFANPLGRGRLRRVGDHVLDAAGNIIGRFSMGAGAGAAQFSQQHPEMQLGGIPSSLAEMVQQLADAFSAKANPGQP